MVGPKRTDADLHFYHSKSEYHAHKTFGKASIEDLLRQLSCYLHAYTRTPHTCHQTFQKLHTPDLARREACKLCAQVLRRFSRRGNNMLTSRLQQQLLWLPSDGDRAPGAALQVAYRLARPPRHPLAHPSPRLKPRQQRLPAHQHNPVKADC